MVKMWIRTLLLVGWASLTTPLWAQGPWGANPPPSMSPNPGMVPPLAGGEPVPLGPAMGTPDSYAPTAPPAACPGSPFNFDLPAGPNAFGGEDDYNDASFYVDLEYLLWWMKSNPAPVLLAYGSLNDTNPGALGQPGTIPIIGNELTRSSFNGARFTGMYRLDHDNAVELSFFFLADHAFKYKTISNANPTAPFLTRPFFNANTGREDSDPITIPGLMAGGVEINQGSQLMGSELNAVFSQFRNPEENFNVDLLAGFRYLSLNQHLDVTTTTVDLPPTPTNVTSINDLFGTDNQFYGGQVGARLEYIYSQVFANLRLKLAVGDTLHRTKIQGSTVISDSNGTTSSGLAGLFAQPSNVGTYHTDDFTFVPELGTEIGFTWHDRLRLKMGYTFLYWSKVYYPGDQINRNVNIQPVGETAMVGPPQPGVFFRSSSFWAQGLNLGIEFYY